MGFTDFNKFKSNQIIINSDRVIINSKSDNIFAISNKDIGVSAGGSLHINIGNKNNISNDNKLVVNSPKIELGLKTKGILEPIAKASSTEDVINDIILALAQFSNACAGATGTVTGGVASLVSINIAASDLVNKLKTIQSKVSKIKSKVSFTI